MAEVKELQLKIGDDVSIRFNTDDRGEWEEVKQIVDGYFNTLGTRQEDCNGA